MRSGACGGSRRWRRGRSLPPILSLSSASPPLSSPLNFPPLSSPNQLTPPSLNAQGHPIGLKLLDLLLHREPPRTQLRPLTIISLLHLIKQNVWTHLFGRQADRLEKSANPETPEEYMIIDNEPLVNTYVSVPRDMSQLNCAAFVAGIVEGVCDGAGFPAKVGAHSVGKEGEGEMWPGRTVFLVKFEGEVLEREKYLGKS